MVSHGLTEMFEPAAEGPISPEDRRSFTLRGRRPAADVHPGSRLGWQMVRCRASSCEE